VDYERQLNIIKRISNLGGLIELSSIAEEVARELTQSYRDQLTALWTPDQSSQWEKEERKDSNIVAVVTHAIGNAKEKLLAENKASHAEEVAEYGVLKMLEGMLNGQLEMEQGSIKRQLIKTLMMANKMSKKEQLSQKLGLNTIVNRYNVTWCLHEIYQMPVVKTPEGLYGHENSNEGRYGYRYASAQEAEYWGLVKYTSSNSALKNSSAQIKQVAPIENILRPMNKTSNLSVVKPVEPNELLEIQSAENQRLRQECKR